MSLLYHPSWFYFYNKIRWRVHIIKFIIMYLSNNLLLRLRSKYLLPQHFSPLFISPMLNIGEFNYSLLGYLTMLSQMAASLAKRIFWITNKEEFGMWPVVAYFKILSNPCIRLGRQMKTMKSYGSRFSVAWPRFVPVPPENKSRALHLY